MYMVCLVNVNLDTANELYITLKHTLFSNYRSKIPSLCTNQCMQTVKWLSVGSDKLPDTVG
jgi:hypothetical protein